MAWSIGDPGDQSPWSLVVRGNKGTVMLLPIAFAMPTFKLEILVRLAIMAINFSAFRIFGVEGITKVGLC